MSVFIYLEGVSLAESTVARATGAVGINITPIAAKGAEITSSATGAAAAALAGAVTRRATTSALIAVTKKHRTAIVVANSDFAVASI